MADEWLAKAGAEDEEDDEYGWKCIDPKNPDEVNQAQKDFKSGNKVWLDVAPDHKDYDVAFLVDKPGDLDANGVREYSLKYAANGQPYEKGKLVKRTEIKSSEER